MNTRIKKRVEKNRADKQKEGLKGIWMMPSVHADLKRFAEENQMSVSAAVREAMKVFLKSKDLPLRKRRSKRVTFWIPPEDYAEFRKAAEAKGLTLAGAIEVALEEML